MNEKEIGDGVAFCSIELPDNSNDFPVSEDAAFSDDSLEDVELDLDAIVFETKGLNLGKR